ncbi:molybdopterin molybdochelatase [Stanieria cyanosphaera PCC 7437]|uniref:Molybdopterin molybdenumtransferase n=1 Tax=Stanieria cyanosphaera (strain ATCC 29371 / PCC 7437) TaxID=111780 RepID=K9XW20_STAC7|nr:gephyrin-like molybdotransferase Glp [Stanieria cyanosphaera]AFZ36785.1 molybdopterin molybdochelatase [Stanieria cyanosphaera PCC 7437]
MLSAKQAEAIILNLVQPLSSSQDVEIVDLEVAPLRILAASVSSKLDFPDWDNSAMDGYAVCYEDVKNCNNEHPKLLEIVEEIPAGYQPKTTIKSGQAARIFTGAMMPAGADTIVIQENTTREGNQVKIFAAPQPKEFVRHRGSFYRAGEEMLPPGIIINAPEIAVLATAQCTKLPVYRRPKVAILSTGDELITPKQPIQPGQIVDSNQYALASFVTTNGGIPIKLGIIPDDCQQLIKAISSAIESADLVLSTGGVSVGDYDYVEQILAQLGGEIQISSVAVKPGKPLTVAKFANGCVYFGIPGNPVSALVSCWRFVQPALKKLSGLKDNWQPTFIKARNRDRLVAGGKRETYLWGKLHLVDGIYEFALAGGSHSSGNLINLAQTNSLAVIPIGQTEIAAGEQVEVMQVNYF